MPDKFRVSSITLPRLSSDTTTITPKPVFIGTDGFVPLEDNPKKDEDGQEDDPFKDADTWGGCAPP
jgi:hypothetical protein